MNPENLKIYSNWVDQKHPSDIKELMRQRNNQINTFLKNTFSNYCKNRDGKFDIDGWLSQIKQFPDQKLQVIEESQRQPFAIVQEFISKYIDGIRSLKIIKDIDIETCKQLLSKYEDIEQTYLDACNTIDMHHRSIYSTILGINDTMKDLEDNKMCNYPNYRNNFSYINHVETILGIKTGVIHAIQLIIDLKENNRNETKENSISTVINTFWDELSDLKMRCSSYLHISEVFVANKNTIDKWHNVFITLLKDLIFKKEQIIKYEAEVKLEQIIASNKSRLFKLANPGISNNEPLTQDNIKKTLLYKYSLDSEFEEFKHINNVEIPLDKLPKHFRCRSIDLMIDLVYFGVGSVLAILYAITQIIGCDKFKDYFLYAGVVVLGFGIIGKICDYVNKCNSYRPSLCCSGCRYNVHLLCSCVTNINTYHNSDLFTNSDDVKDYNDSCMGKCINNIV